MTHVISGGRGTEVLPVIWLGTTTDGAGQPEQARAKLTLSMFFHPPFLKVMLLKPPSKNQRCHLCHQSQNL